MTRPLRVLTWHVHGSYLAYLAHVPCEFWLPTKPGRPEGYGGRAPHWRANVRDVPAERVREEHFDLVLYQSQRNWLVDRHEILSARQRRLPQVFLEHDPPREVPTDTRHPVDDPDVLVVHVTHFNDLMWDSGHSPTRVIEHGVAVPDEVRWSGEVERALTIVNGLDKRGRRLGADVFARVRERVPVDLVGIDSERSGGLGEVPHADLPAFEARYRCLFNPIRYTSLGLAVCEALQVGLPVVGLATTEMATAVVDGVTGFVDTHVGTLVERLRALLDDRALAARMSAAAREYGRERFALDRFVREWDETLRDVTG